MPSYSSLLREEMIEFREYQDSIARKSAERNTLVVIPTALGKTVIAIIAISIVIEKGGKALFLAPTRPLVHQHAVNIKKLIDLPEDQIVEVTGQLKREVRTQLYKSARIIVSTPQVIHNDQDFFSELRNDIRIIVFDEAHRAIGDYSYVAIASYFTDARILATTASPGGEREKIDSIIKNLRIDNLEIRDENSPDVINYVKGIDAEVVRLSIPPGNKEIVNELNDILSDLINRLKSFTLNIQGKSRKELITLGDVISSQIRAGNKSFYAAARIRSNAILVDYLLEFAETQGVLPFSSYLAEMRRENKNSKKIFEDPRMNLIEKRVAGLVTMPLQMHTPKAAKILEILETSPSTKTIIFCHYRITANIISAIIQKEGLKCQRFVGQSSHGKEHGMSQGEQKEIIEQFRKGDIRILVATQVGEEGLDIPSADLVIFYEPVPSGIRSIQRRGRTGRFGKGKAVILVMNDSRDIPYLYVSGRKEKSMKYILNEKKTGRSQTTMDRFLSGR